MGTGRIRYGNKQQRMVANILTGRIGGGSQICHELSDKDSDGCNYDDERVMVESSC